MTIEALEKQIKESRYESVYLFYGPEEYLKRRALASLREALLPAGLEDLNENRLEGCDARAIMDCADTLPVMCDRRLVVVRDWAPIASGRNKADEKELGLLLEWLRNPPESCALVFYMSVEFDAKRKGLKPLMELNGAVCFEHQEGQTLYKSCTAILKRAGGKKLARDAFEELNTRVGSDLTILSGELEKLASYVGEAPEITAADVAAVVTPSPEYLVFKILDSLFAGDLGTATLTANSVLEDSSMNPVRLINTLASQLRTDLYVKCSEENPDTPKDALALLRLNPYRVKYISRAIRGIPLSRLRRGYLLCTEMNYAITSGRIGAQAALNDLLYRLSLKED